MYGYPSGDEMRDHKTLFRLITRADVILFAALVLSALAVFIMPSGTVSEAEELPGETPAGMEGTDAGSALFAVVTVQGETYGIYPLDTDRTIPIRQGEGTDSAHENVLVIENGKIRMESSDCRNQICVQSGEKDVPGEMIVCLPNWVYVEVVGAGGESSESSGSEEDTSENGYDAVSR